MPDEFLVGDSGFIVGGAGGASEFRVGEAGADCDCDCEQGPGGDPVACCMGIDCQMLSPSACVAAGGISLGPGTTCTAGICGVPGGCHFPPNSENGQHLRAVAIKGGILRCIGGCSPGVATNHPKANGTIACTWRTSPEGRPCFEPVWCGTERSTHPCRPPPAELTLAAQIGCGNVIVGGVSLGTHWRVVAGCGGMCSMTLIAIRPIIGGEGFAPRGEYNVVDVSTSFPGIILSPYSSCVVS